MYLNIVHCRSTNRGYGGRISMHSSVGVGHLRTGVDLKWPSHKMYLTYGSISSIILVP
jgi:hypothetical protein